MPKGGIGQIQYYSTQRKNALRGMSDERNSPAQQDRSMGIAKKIYSKLPGLPGGSKDSRYNLDTQVQDEASSEAAYKRKRKK